MLVDYHPFWKALSSRAVFSQRIPNLALSHLHRLRKTKVVIGRYLFNPTEEQFIASMEIHLKRFGHQTFWALNQAQRLP